MATGQADDLKAYLTANADVLREARGGEHEGWYWQNRYELLLEHGVTAEKIRGKYRVGGMAGPTGECYRNAGRIVIQDWSERYVYCEGVMVGGDTGGIPIPLPHAWLYDTKTNLWLDPTWEDPKVGWCIPFQGEWVRRQWVTTRLWCILDDWEHGWPIFSTEPRHFLRNLS